MKHKKRKGRIIVISILGVLAGAGIILAATGVLHLVLMMILYCGELFRAVFGVSVLIVCSIVVMHLLKKEKKRKNDKQRGEQE